MTPGLLSFTFGLFSMGFQLLGSRLLSPVFGSTIIVWAFLISTFLAAFSLGSLWGGHIARQHPRFRLRPLVAAVALAAGGFLLNALAARMILAGIDARQFPLPIALTLACGLLFLAPVCGLAALTPVLVQRLSETGREAGWASGVIYAVGTLGNIVGIMLTVFVLIPLLPVSTLLWLWTGAVTGSGLAFLRWMRP